VPAAASAFSYFRLLPRLFFVNPILGSSRERSTFRHPLNVGEDDVRSVIQKTHGELIRSRQSGHGMPAYTPGMFSPFTKTYVDQFSRWYAAR
jgi:hypothetical protein